MRVRITDDGEAMRALIAAIRFLTRLPVPGPETRVQDLPPAVGWYPLVGAVENKAFAPLVTAA